MTTSSSLLQDPARRRPAWLIPACLLAGAAAAPLAALAGLTAHPSGLALVADVDRATLSIAVGPGGLDLRVAPHAAPARAVRAGGRPGGRP